MICNALSALANFRRVVKTGLANMHPVVAGSPDAEMFEKVRSMLEAV